MADPHNIWGFAIVSLFLIAGVASCVLMLPKPDPDPYARCKEPNFRPSLKEAKVMDRLHVNKRDACEYVFKMEALEWWEREGKYQKYQKQ